MSKTKYVENIFAKVDGRKLSRRSSKSVIKGSVCFEQIAKLKACYYSLLQTASLFLPPRNLCLLCVSHNESYKWGCFQQVPRIVKGIHSVVQKVTELVGKLKQATI